MSRLIPHPAMTFVLAAGWCALAGSLSANSVLFGLALGLVIPAAMRPFGPDSLKVRHWHRAAAYALIVLYDIVVSNVVVARIVLFMPRRDLRPAWIAVPLELTNAEAIAVLSGTITMTPGTLTADLSADGRALLVHCLHAPDPEAVRDQIKSRYEARLKEIME